MISIKLLLTIVALNLLLANCSSLNSQGHDDPPNVIYANAQQKLKNCNWKQAIVQLEKLHSRYPFSDYSSRALLDLICAYYKNSDFLLAQTSINRFMRLNPTHPNIDYIIYMRGLTSIALDNNPMLDFFGIDNSDRDPQHARDAFNDFSKLVRDYPKSDYVSDSTKRLILLKDRLAKYEYSIASYYTRRGAWVAVVNRVKGMLNFYPDTQATRDGLKLMENAYRLMRMNSQAERIAKIITNNCSDA